MSVPLATRDLAFEPVDNARLANFVGPMDENLRHVEQRLDVQISRRGGWVEISGAPEATAAAEHVLRHLFELSATEALTPDRVHLAVQEAGMEPEPDAATRGKSRPADDASIHTQRGGIRGRGPNQRQYLHNIRNCDLTFGIGPAGTGKTYLAVACAVEALQTDRVRRIVLVRPAVEAGERLGFLPGDIGQKVDPYLRPMYDALYDMMGFDRVARAIERQIIEIAPLAFMRGRSLNDAFIILDEAQNTSIEQMKMFLTRMGFGSKAVVTGDITQTDLPRQQLSGLRHVMNVLPGVEGVAFTYFNSRDVVRHPLVQRIVQAYERKQADARQIEPGGGEPGGGEI
ncbi:PhoH [Steroidobacter denitrificans]|uniref:PhoH-like protein n=1 Tax=Steroidobacter denitrificans TaxID=465721 RepID=A0A127FAD0_STEDE|nr:PhoH family protein [Steroidobacter denitrificans]AMN46550.1 PhoH [Steroidobacter denitrificans]